MKRLIIVSILALVAMMGTAAAYGSTLYEEDGATVFDTVNLTPGQSVTMVFRLQGFSEPLYGTYDLTKSVNVLSGMGSSSDIIIDAPASIVMDTPTKDVIMTLTLDENADPGSTYLFNVGYGMIVSQGEVSITYDVDEGGIVNSIPEFPTIALPVAAILGLAFFMQRRKEE